jgi:hypothetical protein
MLELGPDEGSGMFREVSWSLPGNGLAVGLLAPG